MARVTTATLDHNAMEDEIKELSISSITFVTFFLYQVVEERQNRKKHGDTKIDDEKVSKNYHAIKCSCSQAVIFFFSRSSLLEVMNFGEEE